MHSFQGFISWLQIDTAGRQVRLLKGQDALQPARVVVSPSSSSKFDIHSHPALQILDLVPLADSVTKLAGTCAYCSSRALFSLRIAADERQALVGGADKYAPVCRRHYTELNELRPLED